LENLIPAYLATLCLHGESVWVRVLSRTTGPKLGVTDLIPCLPVLEAIVESDIRRIMVAAPTLALGELLSARKRAMVARVRQRTLEGRNT
jgi:hypothetical protein